MLSVLPYFCKFSLGDFISSDWVTESWHFPRYHLKAQFAWTWVPSFGLPWMSYIHAVSSREDTLSTINFLLIITTTVELSNLGHQDASLVQLHSISWCQLCFFPFDQSMGIFAVVYRWRPGNDWLRLCSSSWPALSSAGFPTTSSTCTGLSTTRRSTLLWVTWLSP